MHHLIFAPHHDDAEFGMGGTIQRFRQMGQHVAVAVCTAGDYRRSDGKLVGSLERQAETRTALTILGVTKTYFFDMMQENRGLEASYSSMVGRIEHMIRDLTPTNVYVCLPSFNQEHRMLYDAMITAFRPNWGLPNLIAYEYPGNCWGPAPPPAGRRYVVLDDVMMKHKLEALNMHRSQFEGRPVGVGPDAALTLAAQRGAEIGGGYAELLYVLKEVV